MISCVSSRDAHLDQSTMNMNENKNNESVLPAENSQVQQENKSSEQRDHQEDAKSNDNIQSFNLDGLTDNNPRLDPQP